ncbi:hypothetical protein ONZ45_g5705 [Pleurotus djamor]|nr:hypothetical protein ONZ45_g17930 [Pleurotus djamor]KAJ8517048.1 hypothetical protein ONZ45_g5705 [Pleurotus djamor]
MSSTAMDTDEQSVVLPSSTTSGLSLSLHPLPILNISEHLTRLKLQTNSNSPFVLGALLGTQTGREVEIVNTFELAVEGDTQNVDHGFLVSRRDQYKQVFPSLEFIGWYTVATYPTSKHIALHDQFTNYCSTPLLLILQPTLAFVSSDVNAQTLPFKAYEPSVEIRDRKTRSVFIEASYNVETGEAERIAVDWTARGGGGGTSWVLAKYCQDASEGKAPKDHATLRALSALVASLPATENKGFREEFDTEYEDVQLTAFLSTMTKGVNTLNDMVDKHSALTAGRDERSMGGPRRRGTGRAGMDWDRMH